MTMFELISGKFKLLHHELDIRGRCLCKPKGGFHDSTVVQAVLRCLISTCYLFVSLNYSYQNY